MIATQFFFLVLFFAQRKDSDAGPKPGIKKIHLVVTSRLPASYFDKQTLVTSQACH